MNRADGTNMKTIIDELIYAYLDDNLYELIEGDLISYWPDRFIKNDLCRAYTKEVGQQMPFASIDIVRDFVARQIEPKMPEFINQIELGVRQILES